ncbi:hypothetical protein PF008_g17164 [Phytophthora fragariae]|uniref:Secreted protein n=1 Tax=Phytophthora fragariae TaxID=53985 RepID=A0A6G0R921_9STRA|nr:hypothetical protein PF008_g17164 [Phytophthora fragariae]
MTRSFLESLSSCLICSVVVGNASSWLLTTSLLAPQKTSKGTSCFATAVKENGPCLYRSCDFSALPVASSC